MNHIDRMGIIPPVRFRLIAILLSGLVVSGALSGAACQDTSSTVAAIGRVRQRIMQQGQLPGPDRKALVRATQSSDSKIASMALLVVAAAVEKGLFGRPEYISLLEKRIEIEDPGTAWVYASWYPLTREPNDRVDVGVALKRERKLASYKDKKGHATHLSPEDKQFCREVWMSKWRAVQSKAGSLLASKRGLDAGDVSWIRRNLDSLIRKGPAEMGSYWRSIRTIVAHRNPR